MAVAGSPGSGYSTPPSPTGCLIIQHGRLRRADSHCWLLSGGAVAASRCCSHSSRPDSCAGPPRPSGHLWPRQKPRRCHLLNGVTVREGSSREQCARQASVRVCGLEERESVGDWCLIRRCCHGQRCRTPAGMRWECHLIPFRAFPLPALARAVPLPLCAPLQLPLPLAPHPPPSHPTTLQNARPALPSPAALHFRSTTFTSTLPPLHNPLLRRRRGKEKKEVVRSRSSRTSIHPITHTYPLWSPPAPPFTSSPAACPHFLLFTVFL